MTLFGLTGGNLQLLLQGALVTIELTFYTVILGTVLAFIGGVLSLSDNRAVRWFVRIYVEVFRGVAAVILLFFAFYSLPLLLGIRLTPMVAGVLALGTNMGAYGTEVARAGIQAVSKGQTEAATAINLTYVQRLRHVILPQAIITMLPPYGNLMIEVMKASAFVALITLNDLLFNAQILRANRAAPTIAVYLVVLVMYFIIAGLITTLTRAAERYFGRGMDIA